MKKVAMLLGIISMIGLQATEFDLFVVDQSGNKRNVKGPTDMSKYVSTNISRKSVGNDNSGDCSQLVNLSDKDKSVIVSSDQFGPLPATLVVKDQSGKELFREVNRDQLVSIFEVPSSVMGPYCTIEVTSAFDDKLMCNKVEKK